MWIVTSEDLSCVGNDLRGSGLCEQQVTSENLGHGAMISEDLGHVDNNLRGFGPCGQ